VTAGNVLMVPLPHARALRRKFADGFPNLFVKDAIRIRNRHVAFLASFQDPGSIFEQLSIIYQLPRMFVGSFTLVLPYFPTGTAERVRLSLPPCHTCHTDALSVRPCFIRQQVLVTKPACKVCLLGPGLPPPCACMLPRVSLLECMREGSR
jgi:hypothetical protein